MAFNVYIKSLIWLVSIGGAGYGLLLLTEPSSEKLDRIKASGASTHLNEEEKRKLLFMRRLKEAAESEPIYLKKKGDQN